MQASAVQSPLESAGQRVLSWLLIALAATGAFLIVHWALTGAAADPWRWAVAVAAAVGVVYACGASACARENDIQRRIGRASALCAACGYSIAEIEPEEDGCRVCPECGSAWRMDDSATFVSLERTRP